MIHSTIIFANLKLQLETCFTHRKALIHTLIFNALKFTYLKWSCLWHRPDTAHRLNSLVCGTSASSSLTPWLHGHLAFGSSGPPCRCDAIGVLTAGIQTGYILHYTSVCGCVCWIIVFDPFTPVVEVFILTGSIMGRPPHQLCDIRGLQPASQGKSIPLSAGSTTHFPLLPVHTLISNLTRGTGWNKHKWT